MLEGFIQCEGVMLCALGITQTFEFSIVDESEWPGGSFGGGK